MSAYKEGTNAMANAATLPLSNIIQGWHCDASEMCSQRAREKGRMEKMMRQMVLFLFLSLLTRANSCSCDATFRIQRKGSALRNGRWQEMAQQSKPLARRSLNGEGSNIR